MSRNGQKKLQTWVPSELAKRFEATTNGTEGGMSAVLRKMIIETMEGREPRPPRGTGKGTQIGVRLKPQEIAVLADLAKSRECTPATWLRSLAMAHLARRPQWNAAEVLALREIFRELNAIGNNVNQIARSLNTSVLSGETVAVQGYAAREAAELVRVEMRRVTAVLTGNFDYWGLPDAERPSAAPGAIEREAAAVRAAETIRKRRPKRRPARFAE